MSDAYKITIKSRGEEAVYVDGQGEFHFDVTHEPPFAVLHASTYWNGILPYSSSALTQQQRELILPRIVAHFVERGIQIKVADSGARDQLPIHYRR